MLNRTKNNVAFLTVAAALTFATFDASAAAMTPAAGHDWNGPYAGIHVGLTFGQYDKDSATVSPDGNTVAGDIGGMVGYNYQTGPHVFGLEVDGTYMDLNDDLINFGTAHFNQDWQSTIRGRYGYALGSWLPYVTAGIALTDTTARIDGGGSATSMATGFAGGGGVDVSFGGNMSGRAELLVTTVPKTDYTIGSTNLSQASTNETFRIGVMYSFGNLLK
jgi:outer membrane immunogenic protein